MNKVFCSKIKLTFKEAFKNLTYQSNQLKNELGGKSKGRKRQPKLKLRILS